MSDWRTGFATWCWGHFWIGGGHWRDGWRLVWTFCSNFCCRMEFFHGSGGDGRRHGPCEAFVTMLCWRSWWLAILEQRIGLKKFDQSIGGALRAKENRGRASLIIICGQSETNPCTAQLRMRCLQVSTLVKWHRAAIDDATISDYERL